MKKSFEELVNLAKVLRAENGCAWDRKQTFESIKKWLLDEANEVAEAIDKKDYENLKEELGDLMYIILFISSIAEEKGLFTIKDSMQNAREKLIRRHSHVFGEDKTDDLDEIHRRWQETKKQEKNDKTDNI
ncbi:hypothetical protein GOV06_04085 [Candidatus Woesearchaeota archaeon]|nr:hypothetical protein [Candidatus Woesearchaeota archaeon]